MIGTLSIEKALCDLGASVSVMPFSVYKKLKVGKLEPSTITLQMADRSIKLPMGVVEDVPIKIGKYFLPVDFVVLDIAEDAHIPIILGRPFLHTAGAIIDVKKGRLTFELGEEKVSFCLGKEVRSPMVQETLYAICEVDGPIALGVPPSLDPCDALMGVDFCAGLRRLFDPGEHFEDLDAAGDRGRKRLSSIDVRPAPIGGTPIPIGVAPEAKPALLDVHELEKPPDEFGPKVKQKEGPPDREHLLDRCSYPTNPPKPPDDALIENWYDSGDPLY